MEVNQDNLKHLTNYIQQTLSPDQSIRKPAEKFLEGVESNQNYPVLLLTLIDKAEIDMTIRVAGAIIFKNYVKRNWGAHLDDNGPDKIHESDRAAVKTLIVTLMLKSPLALQKQLSDAVSIIGKYDFPKKWPQLIDEMVEKFTTGDFNVINGVLQTAHSLFKRYRYEFKSQELWEEIKFVLDRMAKPLTNLLAATMNLTTVHASNEQALKVIYGSLVLVCKVFYSLNAQDLPEFFEDNMATWMNAFHELLTTDVPCLKTGEDEEAGTLEHLKSQVCENVGLYAMKYDDEFSTYMPQFVKDIWELLVVTGKQPKYDALVSNALQFLSVVADRNKYRNLFEEPGVLTNICEKVAIPNMDFRPSDEELFEDNPEEYIRWDIEGSDIETRRRSACDLIKTLSENFEEKIFEIFGQYLQILLAQYAENPTKHWRAKNTAIYLVTSFAVRRSTQKHGVTRTSEFAPIPQFFQQQILPELQRKDINELPVLKADSLKFLMVFRTILGEHTISATFPELIRHLPASNVVVHSYAACTIEKCLIMRDAEDKPMITNTFLAPLSNDLLIGLFGTLSLEGSHENEYVMKAIMRSFSTLQELTMPFMAIALPRLTEILTLVAKNPSRPHFNHYLFETLSLAVKIVCKTEASAVSSFEEALFPVFQGILQQDILEFMPYVFQMLSLLLEIREGTSAIPEPYWNLFPCLLAPALWDRPGNVTPLIRLITAFIKQGASQISAQAKLNPILGIFQKMIASKSNDHEGFYLLQNLISYYPLTELQNSMQQIFALLFQRLSLSKTTKYVRGLIIFFGYYAIKIGAGSLVELIDTIQASMFGMVVERVFIADLSKVSTEMDKKIVGVGITKVLTECPAMLNPPYVALWPRLLQELVNVLEAQVDYSTPSGDHFIEVEDTPGYQVAFSQLNFAQPKKEDFLSEVSDARNYLAEGLMKLSQSRPGVVPTLIAQIDNDHRLKLQSYFPQGNFQLQ